jgi:hypothetical protein
MEEEENDFWPQNQSTCYGEGTYFFFCGESNPDSMIIITHSA